MQLGDFGVAPELTRVERTLRDGGRVWLVGQPMVPPAGEPPPHLPPAPTAPTGWRAGPYLDGWEAQLGVLLRTRAREVRRIAGAFHHRDRDDAGRGIFAHFELLRNRLHREPLAFARELLLILLP
jgi:hypothetical protein